MPRRSFLLRHARLKQLDEQTREKFVRQWRTGDLYHHPEAFPRLTSRELFLNDRPLEMEIACGTGEFICALAAERPGTNFLGIDINLKSLLLATERAVGAHLENVRFIKAPVQYVYPLLVPESLQAIYLHFPEPRTITRFERWQIFGEEFLDIVYATLVEGGKLSVVTDAYDYFLEMLGSIEQDPRFEKMHKERYLAGFEPPAKSRYQLYWEGHGVTIYRFEVVKSVAGSG